MRAETRSSLFCIASSFLVTSALSPSICPAQKKLVALDTSAQQQQPSAATRSNIDAKYAQLPISFEANRGQAGTTVKFFARGKGCGLYLTGQEAVLALHSNTSSPHGKLADSRRLSSGKTTVLRMQLRGANPAAKSQGIDALAGTINYFIGISTATVRYTTDGSTPTTHSNFYTGPITLKASETIKAISISTGASASNIASSAFTLK